uniref:Endonuclease/exonuclease/phosphatase domain-containing protein n=2 Tax=Graphocephala atropunctata TaxID=36148 RepID=A0A1B6KH11_9HEMI
MAYFCRTEHRGGGVAIYVEENLKKHTEEIDVHQFCEELTLEAALVKIRYGKSNLHILGTYRPPNGNFNVALEILSDIITSTKTDNYPLVIMGDINVDILSPDRKNVLLDETLATHNIKRLQLPATRITPLTKSSIDWICTNINIEKITPKVIHAGLSDHTAQSCSVNFSKIQSNPPRMGRCLRRKNLQELKCLLGE